MCTWEVHNANISKLTCLSFTDVQVGSFLKLNLTGRNQGYSTSWDKELSDVRFEQED